MSEILFDLSGVIKVINYIRKGKIVDINGKNGIGKTTAVKLLEIISNNHIFPDKYNFDGFRGAFEKCHIHLNISESEKYRVELNPRLWFFDKISRKIKIETLGKFFLNEKEIEPKRFLDLWSIRVFRGDETPTKQIEYLNSYLQSFSNEKKEFFIELDKKLKIYQNYLENDFQKDFITDYREKNKLFSDYNEEIENEEKIIEKNESLVKNYEIAFTSIKNLKFILENNNEKLIEEQNEKSKQISEIENKIKKITEEKITYRNNFEKDKEDIDENVKLLMKNYEENSKKQKKIITLLQSLTKNEFTKEFLYNTTPKEIETTIEIQKTNLHNATKNLEEEIEKEKPLIRFNSLVKRVYEISKEAVSYGSLIDQPSVIELDEDNYHVIINFNMMNDILKLKVKKMSAEDKIVKFKEIMKQNSEQLDELQKVHKNFKELLKIKKEMDDIKKELQSNHIEGLDNYMGGDKKENYLEKMKEFENKTIILEDQKDSLKSRLDQLVKIKEELEKLEDQISYEKRVNELKINGIDLTKPLSENLEFLTRQIQGFKDNNTAAKKNIEKINKNLDKLKKDIDELRITIKKNAEKHGFERTIDWLHHIDSFLKKIENTIRKADDFKTIFSNFESALDKNKKGTLKTSDNYGKIINTFFKNFFIETYNQKEYFEYVFTEYKELIDFDAVQGKKLKARRHDGEIEIRDIESFSSGEKAYAFIRPMMMLDLSNSKYKIIVLDELNALMDYSRRNSLAELELKLIQDEIVTKIVNINPINDESMLDNISPVLLKEFKQNNFFQEIVKD